MFNMFIYLIQNKYAYVELYAQRIDMCVWEEEGMCVCVYKFTCGCV